MADQPNSIFENTNTSTQTQEKLPVDSNTQGVQTNNDYADLLGSIKNERGEQKYSTLAEALNGLRNAQEFIPTLKTDLAQRDAELNRLREENQRMQTLEETVAALTTQRERQDNTNAPVFDEKKLAELVNQTLTRKEQEAVAKQNVQAVVSTLQQSFGADAEQKFYAKAEELGMTLQEMNSLAAKSPKAVLTMLGINSQSLPTQKQLSANQGSVNTAALQPHQDTFIGRNPKTALVGATTQDINEASKRAKDMVDELHSQGRSVHELSDPKNYFKYFK